MTSGPPELIDNFSIALEFDRFGWSRFHLLWTKAAHSFWVSDVFQNFADDMVTFSEAVLDNTALRLALCDEPGGVILALVPQAKAHHVVELVIEQVEDPLAGFDATMEGRVIQTVLIKRKQLITMLMCELWKTHVFLKDPAYQADRDPFPHGRLVALNRRWNDSDLGPSVLK